MVKRCSTLLLLLYLHCSLSSPALGDNYLHNRLEDFCYKNGAKREVRMHKPHLYTFNSSITSKFTCHLELELMTGVGFSVEIESMNLVQTAACSSDWIMFGKDVMFITTKRSRKFCDFILPDTKHKENEYSTVPERGAGRSNRFYIDEGDEMDLWIQIEAGEGKELSLVVTPHYTCSQDKRKYRACPNSSECIPSYLFCDGRVNCVNNGLDEDSRFCPNLEVSGITDNSLGIRLLIIISVCLVVFLVLILLVAKVKKYRQNRLPPPSSPAGQTAGHQTLLSEPCPLTERGRYGRETEGTPPCDEDDMPTHPPPYYEICHQIPQDPPKYDEINKTLRVTTL